jgi:aspartate kinase
MTVRHDAPIVLKFGGSAFLDLECYRTVADHVIALIGAGGRAVVVVSAMSGTTGRLQETLRLVNRAPSPEESCMMLTPGEMISVALLTAAFHDRGVPAIGMAGARIGLVASGPADRATLRTIDKRPLADASARFRVVIVPGGQGSDDDGHLVMLGRNSSDLSAIAAAIAVGASSCEIFSDVPGIFTADPRLVPTAQVLPEIGYDALWTLSRAGAKVLHWQAVEWARANGISIVCRSLPPTARCGTVVHTTGPPVAAALLHIRGEVWSFPDRCTRAAAAAHIRAEGLDALAVEHEHGGAMLVTTTYGRDDVAGRCCARGTPYPDLCLLTVLHTTGRVERVVIPRADGIHELRRRHDLLYPPSTAAPRSLVASEVVNGRSAHSGLLLGATEIQPAHAR